MRPIIFSANQFYSMLEDLQGDKQKQLLEVLANKHILVNSHITLPDTTRVLPPHLTFGGDLQASKAQLAKFNAEVKGFTNFSGNQYLREVGPNAMFGKKFFGANSSIETFEGTVHNSADFSNCRSLRFIPRSAQFNGDVICNDSNIGAFEADVRGNAQFNNTPNFSLGALVKISGNLTATNSGIETFKNEVGGNADLSKSNQLDIIFPQTKIGRNLDLSDSSVRIVEGDVIGELNIDNVKTLERIGPEARFGSVRAKGANIQHFEAVVTMDADFENSTIKYMSKDSSFGGAVSGYSLSDVEVQDNTASDYASLLM